MTDLAEDFAEQAVHRAVEGQTHPTFRARILTQTVRVASRMLAEEVGHEGPAILHSTLVREHNAAKNRQGVQRGRGGR